MSYSDPQWRTASLVKKLHALRHSTMKGPAYIQVNIDDNNQQEAQREVRQLRHNIKDQMNALLNDVSDLQKEVTYEVRAKRSLQEDFNKLKKQRTLTPEVPPAVPKFNTKTTPQKALPVVGTLNRDDNNNQTPTRPNLTSTPTPTVSTPMTPSTSKAESSTYMPLSPAPRSSPTPNPPTHADSNTSTNLFTDEDDDLDDTTLSQAIEALEADLAPSQEAQAEPSQRQLTVKVNYMY